MSSWPRQGTSTILERVAALTLIVAGVAGCDRDTIHAYRAPKDPGAVAVAPTPAPVSTTSAPMTEPTVVWTLPEGWTEAPTTQAMRLATFRAGDAGIEIALSAFPGDVGGMLANVNRWRGQIGLAPVTEPDLPGLLETTIVDGVEVTIVDMESADGSRLLGAIVPPGDGKTWFAKAVDQPLAIEAIRPSFIEFARSIHLDSTHTHAEHNHPVSAPGGPVAGASVDERLAGWSLPMNWKHEESASPILSASYLADNDSGGARITVTRLNAGAGGDLANINRWRGQMGLAPVESLDASAGVINRDPITVDLGTPDGGSRMVAAIVPAGPSTYYFKMTGSADGAGAEMDGFNRLVREVGLGAAVK